ncbi:MAG: tetratricopeptide repeat protein [Dysgonamonadaceae bacterium]|jgi:tetratricopeptide (TPR) repeat protein|nr:tetratricopeptide repeat protein [Dysgonamonadaceae bacterium]
MRKIVLILCLSAGILTVSAQRSASFQAPERLFQEGKQMFDDRNFAGCIDKIHQYKSLAKDSDRIAEADYLLLASDYYQGYQEVKQDLIAYWKAHSTSIHANEIAFMTGSLYFAQADYHQAITWLKRSDMDYLSEIQQEDYAYRLAVSSLKTGDTKEAFRLFSLLKMNGKNYRAATDFYLAYIHYSNAEYNQALVMFNALKDQREYLPETLYYLSQIHFAQKRYTQTIADGTNLLSTYPNNSGNTEMNRIIGLSYYYEANYQQAAKYLEKFVSSGHRVDPLDYYTLGVSYFDQKNYPKAIEYLNLSQPDDTETGQSAYLYLGQSYLNTKDYKNALRAFESASKIEASPHAQEAALYNYSMLLHQTSNSAFGESVTALENFLNKYPNSIYATQVNNALIDVYFTTQNYNTALASIAKIKNPGKKILEAKQQILYYLGTIAFTNKDYTNAIRYFTETVDAGSQANNEKNKALYWRGESYYLRENYMAAAKDYTAFLQTTGNNEGNLRNLANYNLGYCYFKQQQYAQAESYFQTFIRDENNKTASLADAYVRVGDCYFQNRQFKEAQTFYDKAINTMPETADYALFQKGLVMGLLKDYQGKIAQLNRLVNDYKTSPYVADALYEKGQAYVMLDKQSDAIEVYQNLLSKYPNSAPTRKAGVQIGLLYFNTRRLPQSVAAYKDVIARYPESEEAKVALQDLQSVYMEMGDLPAYTEYVRSLGGTAKWNAVDTEETLAQTAELQYQGQEYSKALQSYQYLQQIATTKTNKEIATMGILRSAAHSNKPGQVVEAADELLKDPSLNPETATEARYYRAKANQSLLKPAAAEQDFETLAKDTRTAFGAEAKYLLAQHYFDTGHPNEAKIIVQDYIQEGTPHLYWLARSYILLSDVYASEKDNLKARQYLESLQTNYKNKNDDIDQLVKERLKKLQ